MAQPCESVKGYLNFFLDRALLVESVLAPVMEQGGRYGSSDMGGGRTVCIDYSSINIAKRFHIGHLPSTVLGHALYRINNFMGYKSVGINHLGDWGTQFGKMIARLPSAGAAGRWWKKVVWTRSPACMSASMPRPRRMRLWRTRGAPGSKRSRITMKRP